MDNVETAQQELNVIAPASQEDVTPKSLDDVIAGLKGFGIEEFEEILTIKCKGRSDLRVKIANIPTSEEMLGVQAADEFKGYLWIKRVKVELISRSISWIDGIDIHNLAPDQRFVPDPTDDGKVRDVQHVLRNILMGWGQELVEVLWKVIMTHSQNIEDRLKEEFPSNATMTEVESRLIERARKAMEESMTIIQDEQVSALYDSATPEKTEEQKG